jgi:hypothetical protein
LNEITTREYFGIHRLTDAEENT